MAAIRSHFVLHEQDQNHGDFGAAHHAVAAASTSTLAASSEAET
jgi:hypothetical protein